MSPARFRRGCAAVLLAASLALLGACSSSGHGGGASGTSAGSTASTTASAAAGASSAPAPAGSAAPTTGAAPSAQASAAATDGSVPTPDGQPGEPGYTQPEANPVPLESPASVADAQVKLVTATYGQDSTPAVMLTSDQQSQTLPDSVAAGGTATGVYDFAVPEGSRDQVVVRVYLNSQEPVAVFSGAVS